MLFFSISGKDKFNIEDYSFSQATLEQVWFKKQICINFINKYI